MATTVPKQKRKTVPLRERLLSKTIINWETGCWEWTASTNGFGYGQFGIGRRHVGAHRAAYELLVGPIPDGLHLDHLCRVRHCINPAHLEPVTCRENVRRSPITTGALNRTKTYCPAGHKYDAENTLIIPNSGERRCRACANAARDRYRQRRKLGIQEVAA